MIISSYTILFTVSLVLAFHPIFGIHITSEPVYLIDISFSRLSRDQFKRLQEGNHYLLHDPFFQVIPPILSNDIIESSIYDFSNMRGYEYLYKTISMDNDETLICIGRVLRATGEPNLEYDLQQIRNIMNSIFILPTYGIYLY